MLDLQFCVLLGLRISSTSRLGLEDVEVLLALPLVCPSLPLTNDWTGLGLGLFVRDEELVLAETGTGGAAGDTPISELNCSVISAAEGTSRGTLFGDREDVERRCLVEWEDEPILWFDDVGEGG